MSKQLQDVAATALPARLVDIETIAELLGVSVRHVRRLVYERRIPYLKWGHLLRFDPLEIAEWLNDKRVHEWLRRKPA